MSGTNKIQNDKSKESLKLSTISSRPFLKSADNQFRTKSQPLIATLGTYTENKEEDK